LKSQIAKQVKNGSLAHLVKAKHGENEVRSPTAGKKDNLKLLCMVRGEHSVAQKGSKRAGELLESWMERPLVFPPQPGDYFVDSLLISMQVGPYEVRIVCIDTRSFSYIIYEQCFPRMNSEDQQRLEPFDESIVGFEGESVKPLGQIRFPVTIGEQGRHRAITLTFLVVPDDSQYNIMLGRLALGILAVAVSTVHGLITFPTPKGVARIWADRKCIATITDLPFPPPADKAEPEK
jgi:hypothetical protein